MILFVVLTLLPCMHINAMHTGNGSFAQVPVLSSNGTHLVHRAVHTHPITGKAQSGSPKLLTDISAHEHYQQEAVTALHYAASGLEKDCVNPSETVDVINYLLTKIDPTYIKNPEKLLIAALENNHPTLFDYVEKTFGTEYTVNAVCDTIDKGQHERFQALLNIGATGLPHVSSLIRDAIDALSYNDDAATNAQRLAILKTILNRAAIKDVPTMFELDFRTIPAHAQDEVKRLLGERLYPPRLGMSEDADETPLHRAAAAGDYETSFAYLTQWSGPLTEDSMFPHEALSTIGTKHNKKKSLQDQSAEVRAASRQVSAFTVNMKNHYVLRFRLAEEQRTAKDSKGRTAQEIAIAAKAQAKLITLLDAKNDDAIKDAIYQNYEQRFMTEEPRDPNKAKQQETKKAPNKKEKAKLKDDSQQPPCKVGEEAIIFGERYVVAKVEKVK